MNSFLDYCREFEIDGPTAKLIWQPRFKFPNVLKYELTKEYGATNTFVFWYLGNQTMEYGEQFQLTFFCHFDFTNFPFDSHECRIEYGDENYGIDDLNVNASTIIYHAYRLFFIRGTCFFINLSQRMTSDLFSDLHSLYTNCPEIKYCAVILFSVLNNLCSTKETISCHILVAYINLIKMTCTGQKQVLEIPQLFWITKCLFLLNFT